MWKNHTTNQPHQYGWFVGWLSANIYLYIYIEREREKLKEKTNSRTMLNKFNDDVDNDDDDDDDDNDHEWCSEQWWLWQLNRNIDQQIDQHQQQKQSRGGSMQAYKCK